LTPEELDVVERRLLMAHGQLSEDLQALLSAGRVGAVAGPPEELMDFVRALLDGISSLAKIAERGAHLLQGTNGKKARVQASIARRSRLPPTRTRRNDYGTKDWGKGRTHAQWQAMRRERTDAVEGLAVALIAQSPESRVTAADVLKETERLDYKRLEIIRTTSGIARYLQWSKKVRCKNHYYTLTAAGQRAVETLGQPAGKEDAG
jgi:hypothetical protein